jgi:hypothetical protein
VESVEKQPSCRDKIIAEEDLESEKQIGNQSMETRKEVTEVESTRLKL